jgi:hypothetical protein
VNGAHGVSGDAGFSQYSSDYDAEMLLATGSKLRIVSSSTAASTFGEIPSYFGPPFSTD